MLSGLFEVLSRARRPDLIDAIVTAGTQYPSDLLRSFNTLAKYENGLWKSDKQGKFLWSWAAKEPAIRPSKEAVAWAKTTGRFDPRNRTQRVVQFITMLSGYGKVDRSKVRYTGTFALIDGTGVLGLASFKVQHPKGDDSGTLRPISGSAKTRFVRPLDVVPEIDLDPRSEQRQKLAKQLKLNEPVIKAIESIPDWQEQRIFQDFHALLLRGGTLTPRMMQVVERNVPAPVVNVGGGDEMVATLKRLDRWVSETVLPVMKDVHGAQDKPGEDTPGRIDTAWQQYRAGKVRGEITDSWVFDDVMNIAEKLARFNLFREIKGARGQDAWAGYPGFRTQLTKALPALKRGKAPTQTALVWLRAMVKMDSAVQGLDRTKVARYYA